MSKKDASLLLKELAQAVVEYNSLRDDEWGFDDEHGNRDFWDEETCDEHEELLDTILASRAKVRNLLREIPGFENVSF